MSVLKIHLTYSFTAQCDHCRFRCSRRSGPAIDDDLVIECVDALKRLNHLELVVLMGGEPGLFPELTHRLTAAITAMGVAVRVETNRTNALLADLEHQIGKRPKVYQGTILFNGQAAERLAPLVASRRGIPTEVCDQVPWWYNSQQMPSLSGSAPSLVEPILSISCT